MIEMHKKPIELLRKRRLLSKKRKKTRKMQRPLKPRTTEHDPRISCHVHVTNLFNI
tara:strand:+ start:670 stop:837 length:168 start_codon:yes stop_codon:yes gene_type:complete